MHCAMISSTYHSVSQTSLSAKREEIPLIKFHRHAADHHHPGGWVSHVYMWSKPCCKMIISTLHNLLAQFAICQFTE